MEPEKKGKITFIRNKEDFKEFIKKNKPLKDEKINVKNKRPYFVIGYILGYFSCYYYYKYKLVKSVNSRNYFLEDEIKLLKLELNEHLKNK
jgi:hypothetical protein